METLPRPQMMSHAIWGDKTMLILKPRVSLLILARRGLLRQLQSNSNSKNGVGRVKENIATLPNFLTASRLVSAPIIGYMVVQHQPVYAASLFACSCLTDYVDGYIARKYKMQSVLGSILDPMADKALMVTLTSCLAVSHDIPVYVAELFLARDILLGLSALMIRYKSLPPPKTISRYWDFSLPSAEVRPMTISKYNTLLQMVYLGSSLLLPVAMAQCSNFPYFPTIQAALKGLEYLVASTTVLSGIAYLFSKKSVRYLKP